MQRFTRHALLAFAAVGAGVMPAVAADLPMGVVVVPTPVAVATPVETQPSWTAFYAGIHGGFGAGILGYTQEMVPGTTDPEVNYVFAEQSVTYGIHAGFDYQLSNLMVVGVEVSTGKENAEVAPFESGGFGTLFSADSSTMVSAKLGVLLNPQALLYTRIGTGIVDVSAEAGLDDIASGTSRPTSYTVGVEALVNQNLSARVELSRLTSDQPFEIPQDFELFDPRFLTVTAGLSYRFGLPAGTGYNVPQTPQYEPDIDWTGFYLGVSKTYGFGSMTLDVDVPGATVGPFGAEASSMGIFAGADAQIGNFIIGAELEANTLDAKFRDPAFDQATPDATDLFATVDSYLATSARVGYAVGPATMIYAKLGQAHLNTAANADFFALDDDEEVRTNLNGVIYGLGIEAGLTDNLSVRAEGTMVKATDSLVVNNSQLQQNTLTPSLVTGKVGLAYRF